MAYVFQVDTDTTLTTSLISYYKLEDVNDTWSTNNWTNNGSITFAAAKVNNGAELGTSNSSKYLSSTSDITNLAANKASFSWAGWLKVNTAPSASSQTIINLTTNASPYLSYIAYYKDVAGTKYVTLTRIKHGVGTYNSPDTAQTFTVGTWYFVVVYDNGTNLYMDVNNSNVITWNYTAGDGNSGAGYSTITAMGTQFNIANYASMMFDEWGVWGKVLSAQEKTDLYNSGSGQTMVEAATTNSNFFQFF